MSDPQPWFPGDAPGQDGDRRQHAPAANRNRDAILSVLTSELPERATILELASGSGEHALYFTQAQPAWTWQPSDSSDDALASINAWRAHAGRPDNLLAPISLDLLDPVWPTTLYDAIFIANLTHIAPFPATEAVFAGAQQCLESDGRIAIYGPFFRDGDAPSEGDIAFDRNLRARDRALGIRHLDEIDAAASTHGFVRTATHAMPANNLTLVYRR